MTTKRNLVIYHDHCIDGFTAAWAAWKFLGEEDTEYVPCNYGQDPRYFQETYGNIYIVDFSFPRDKLVEICTHRAEKVILLDHHKTAQADLENWADRPENLFIEFDMSRSGAGITWDYFAKLIHPSELSERPPLINYVEDRDLWKFQLYCSKEVSAYIANMPKTFDDWENLAATSVAECREVGRHLLHQHQQICESIVLDARKVTIYGLDGTPYIGLAANCTGQFASEVGNLLAISSNTFGASYFSDKDGAVKWSLRSCGDYDVSAIAKQFGGGGHKNAAGFRLQDIGRDTEREINLWSAVPVGGM